MKARCWNASLESNSCCSYMLSGMALAIESVHRFWSLRWPIPVCITCHQICTLLTIEFLFRYCIFHMESHAIRWNIKIWVIVYYLWLYIHLVFYFNRVVYVVSMRTHFIWKNWIRCWHCSWRHIVYSKIICWRITTLEMMMIFSF